MLVSLGPTSPGILSSLPPWSKLLPAAVAGVGRGAARRGDLSGGGCLAAEDHDCMFSRPRFPQLRDARATCGIRDIVDPLSIQSNFRIKTRQYRSTYIHTRHHANSHSLLLSQSEVSQAREDQSASRKRGTDTSRLSSIDLFFNSRTLCFYPYMDVCLNVIIKLRNCTLTLFIIFDKTYSRKLKYNTRINNTYVNRAIFYVCNTSSLNVICILLYLNCVSIMDSVMESIMKCSKS